MNLKIALAASLMTVLAGLTALGALGGCGGDDCTAASDHLNTCLKAPASESAQAGVACTGSTLCTAQCLNAASCSAIADAFSGKGTNASKTLLDCMTSCQK